MRISARGACTSTSKAASASHAMRATAGHGSSRMREASTVISGAPDAPAPDASAPAPTTMPASLNGIAPSGDIPVFCWLQAASRASLCRSFRSGNVA
ncbi:hypothetical protein G6F24_018587 [Rhizopus arrhizus]|nr:hypothetical protein G6F24_018587 [Rhizopus arrhizus]